MKSLPIACLFFIMLNCIPSCAQEKKGIELGQFDGSTYVNQQFDLSIEIPESWYFMDKDQRSMAAKKNAKKMLETNADQEQILELSLESTALIFAIFKYKPDTIMEVNPNMTITATNIEKTPNLKDLDYALEQSKTGMKEMGLPIEIKDTIIEAEINKKQFKGFNSTITYNGMSANYESYLGNFDKHNLLITISYKNEIQKAELLNILNSIRTIERK